jgi:hypothetical protein
LTTSTCPASGVTSVFWHGVARIEAITAASRCAEDSSAAGAGSTLGSGLAIEAGFVPGALLARRSLARRLWQARLAARARRAVRAELDRQPARRRLAWREWRLLALARGPEEPERP